MILAVRELGMDPEKFWDLLWCDWALYVLHIEANQKKQKADLESRIELTRQMMALIANLHRDPKKRPRPIQGTDFFRLSYDTVVQADTIEFADVVKRFGSKLKKDGK